MSCYRSKAQIAKIIEGYENGMSVFNLAKNFRAHYRTIFRILKCAGKWDGRESLKTDVDAWFSDVMEEAYRQRLTDILWNCE